MIETDLHKKLWSPAGEMDLKVQFQLQKAEIVVLYGGSGAGKTSILRMMAGLLNPDHGYIVKNDIHWYSSQNGVFLKPQKRELGMLFQDYTLFPNMNVKQNLEFALTKRKGKKRIKELIDLMELGDLQSKMPATLSGGQRQRVALAQALVNRPGLLLLDEPLSALDREMRAKLQLYLLEVHKEYQFTILMVSHDVSEIVKMAHRVLVLESGSIAREGSPAEIFAHQEVSGKFQFTGEVLKIEQKGFLSIISVLIGKDLVRVVADEQEVLDLTAGDQVLIASKAFNPVIRKIS